MNPRGRSFAGCFLYLHLEDTGNFKGVGEGFDVDPRPKGTKVYGRRRLKKRGAAGRSMRCDAPNQN